MPITTFTITAGSTLGGIAKKFGVPLGVLIDTNGITDPNKIKVGQVLTIPSTSTDAMDHPEPVPAAVLSPPPAGLAINQKKFRLPLNCFMQQETNKDLILLHYTAGRSAQSAFDTWVQAHNQVATAYVLDVDGTIYEMFDPKFWAFHLGVGTDNHREHKRSIGIEIVNPGVLKLDPAKPDQLNWWPNEFRTKFCTTAETGKFVKKSFRGFDFHATYPEVQIAQVGPLVRHLCERFGIPKKIPAVAQRELFDLAFARGYSGVISHQSFRKDKFDVGPAFDWSRVFPA